MLPAELGPADSGQERSWYETAWKNLRKRWVQVTIVLLAGTLAASASGYALAPRPARRELDTGKFKYLYCPECQHEVRYDPKLDGEDCTKCRTEPVGKLVGSEESHRDLSVSSGWKGFYLALTLEALATLGGVVYLLYRPVPDPAATFHVCNCPHCGQRLRFRQVSLGGLGQCTRCKRPLRFPDEDDAVLESDLMREESERLTALEAEAEADDDEE